MRDFLIKLFSQTTKNIIFCEASATFQGSHKMLPLPRLLPLCHVCAALTMRFMKKALWTRHKMLRLPRMCETPHCKVLRLPRENDTLALTRFQSIAPVTRNAKTSTSFKLHMQRESPKTPPEALPDGSELTTRRRRRHDDDTTTT